MTRKIGRRRMRKMPKRVYNMSLRTVYILSLAERRGHITVGQIGATFYPNGRSKKTDGVLKRLLRQRFLRRVGEDHTYTLDARGREYLRLAGELLSRAAADPKINGGGEQP